MIFDLFLIIAYPLTGVINKKYGDYMNKVCEYIKNARAKAKISLRKAAREIGISHVTLYYIERGRFYPRLSTIQKIADYYKLDIKLIDLENNIWLYGMKLKETKKV